MHIIIERENAIENFKSVSYWYFIGAFKLKADKDIDLSDVKMYQNDTVYKTENVCDVKDILRKLQLIFIRRRLMLTLLWLRLASQRIK